MAKCTSTMKLLRKLDCETEKQPVCKDALERHEPKVIQLRNMLNKLESVKKQLTSIKLYRNYRHDMLYEINSSIKALKKEIKAVKDSWPHEPPLIGVLL